MPIAKVLLKYVASQKGFAYRFGIVPVTFILGATFLLPGASFGPDAMRPKHRGRQTPQVINGSQTPQLIPDAVAYRLFFDANTLPDNPSPADFRKQKSRLHIVGLNKVDEPILNEEITKFHTAYASLTSELKQAVEASQSTGVFVDRAGFNIRREALVQATQLELQSVLTADGVSRLNKFVQREKLHMKVVKSASMP